MFDKKSLKKALIASTALIGGVLLFPASAIAISCPSTILGNELSGVICDFDTGSNVNISSGVEVGGISQSGYNPVNSSIINNGTISNDTQSSIDISDSSLSNGLTNNGIITTIENSGILIDNASTISGGISNASSITSENYIDLQLDGGSTINGSITNRVASSSAIAMIIQGCLSVTIAWLMATSIIVASFVHMASAMACI